MSERLYMTICGTASTPTETEIDITKWNAGEYHTKQQLMDCVNEQAEKIKLLESELKKRDAFLADLVDCSSDSLKLEIESILNGDKK